MTPELTHAYEKLRDVLRSHGSMLIAYSGGVDSGLLTFVAHRELGENAHAMLGVSDSLGEREHERAVEFLETHGIPYSTLETGEMGDERYRRNHADRCYFCKQELFTGMTRAARERGFDRIAYGANTDDLGDHRPGARAAGEADVVAPLVEAGLDKATVRLMARALGLSLWDKPAAPCLASRVPYYQEVTPEKLRQIEAAENLLEDRGFPIRRVRHYGAEARIEVPAEDHVRLLDGDVWDDIVAGLRRVGFEEVKLQEGGFRSGRLNDVLPSAGRLDSGTATD